MEKWKKNYSFVEVGKRPEMSTAAIGNSILLQDLLSKDEGHLSECQEEGAVEDNCPILDKIKEMGGRVVHKYIAESYSSSIWLWDDSILEVEFTNQNYLRVNASSQNEKFITVLRAMVTPMLKEQIEQGHIFAIIRNGSHLQLHNIGNAGIPVIPGNYTPKVIEDYKFVVSDLNSISPSGRIVILEGEPGTGKTHLVRSWLMDVPDAMFVLVSPDMVSSLGGPELLPLLLTHKHNAAGPIILVLEDADKCLVTRAGDNINSIQALLNLGDGILGSLLDLRIIATTNAKRLEMESAILRPGRLSKRMEVGPLDQATAYGIFNRLLPGKNVPAKLIESTKPTLAEVYAVARSAGWMPEAREKAKDPSEALVDKAIYDDDDDD